MREIDGARASPPAWYPPLATKSKDRKKPSRIRGLAFFGYMKLFPYFLGGSRHFSAGTRRCFSRWTVSCRSKAYSTLHRGINTSIPRMPMRLPPTVTAASTQMEGSPTEEPTTWG